MSDSDPAPEPFTLGDITIPADEVAELDPEKAKQRRDLFTCPECGRVADLRLDAPEVGQKYYKNWMTVHDAGGRNATEVYVHVDVDAVDRERDLARYLAAMDTREDDDPEPVDDRPDLDEYHRQKARERHGRFRTDGGRRPREVPVGELEDAALVFYDGAWWKYGETAGPKDTDWKQFTHVLTPADAGERIDILVTDGGEPEDWTEQYPTTTYRGPQQYPVPGAWVLGYVEGDGIGWRHYPGHGEDANHNSDLPGEVTFDGPSAYATLTNHHPPDADVMDDPPYHELKLDGELVLVLKDASEVTVPEWWRAIAEALARYDRGEDVDGVLVDLGLEHLQWTPPEDDTEDPTDPGPNGTLDGFGEGPRTDGGVDLPDTVPLPEWERKAHENVQKWGQQPADALLLAMGEELGELADEVHGMADYPDADGDDQYVAEHGRDLIRRMGDLGRDIQNHLEMVSERDGEPVPPEDRPRYLDPFPPDLKRSRRERLIQSELDDLMALGYQFLWALETPDGGDG